MPGGDVPPPQTLFFFLLTSSDLSGLKEECQGEGWEGEIPDPSFRFPPGPGLHLLAPCSQLWTHEIATADQLRPFQGIAYVCYTAIRKGEGVKKKKRRRK